MAVFNKFVQHSGGLFISAVSIGELYTWALRKGAGAKRLAALDQFLTDLRIVGVDASVARIFGEVRATLFDQGISLPTADLLIASTAMLHDLTLVTHNIRHFASIPDLRIQDWIA